MKSPRIVVPLAVAFLALVSHVPLVAPQTIEAPSLDRLHERVLEHWNLLARGNRVGAAEFVRDIEERNRFLANDLPPFTNPHLDGFDMADYPDAVIVRTEVTLPLQGLDLPIFGLWIAGDGDWYLSVPERDIQGLYTGDPRPNNANELIIASFEDGFRPQDAIVLPDDVFGDIVSGTIDYTFAGVDRIQLQRVSGPEGLSVNRSDLLAIRPGAGSIRYTFTGTTLFDNDLPDLVLRLRMGDLSSDVSIPVIWNGTPDYRYRFRPENPEAGYQGEIVLEIDNLTEETWTPGVAEVIGGTLDPHEFPEQPIGPGETARYTFQTTSPLNAERGTLVINLPPRQISVAFPEVGPPAP